MKSFLIRICIYFIGVAALTRASGALVADGWENQWYYAKEAHFLSAEVSNCNTLFFGSSRTFAHVDPIIFDSLNATEGVETNSFMLAVGSTFVNESLYFIEELFSDKLRESELRTVFVEVDEQTSITRASRYKPEAIFYISWSNIGILLKRIWAAPYSEYKKVIDTGVHLVSCFVTMTEFGYGIAKLRYAKDSDLPPSRNLWYARKGHRALDYEKKELSVGSFYKRHAKLVADTTCLKRTFTSIAQASHISSENQLYNRKLLDAYTAIAKMLNSKGIRVIYVLPIRAEISPQLKALYEALHGDYKIDMSAVVAMIPELRYSNHWFDPGHLNVHGARLYTTALSREWVELLKHTDAPTN